MSLVPLPIEHLMPVGYPMARGARYYLCMTAWENLQRPRRAAAAGAVSVHMPYLSLAQFDCGAARYGAQFGHALVSARLSLAARRKASPRSQGACHFPFRADDPA
jgi:hypothetical protein